MKDSLRLVGESEDGSDGRVGERVADSVVLAQILVLEWRVQILELDPEPTLAQRVRFGQVVVQLELGGVQVILVIAVIIVAVMIIVVIAVMIVVVAAVMIVVIAAVMIVVVGRDDL